MTSKTAGRLKFETKSNRVKGLAFHPTRPWLLASLHNGVIQLWDYRIRALLERFDEHTGPVRSVCFHPTQPLFVSGGDDYKIKVWNYKKRRCLFTLVGHLDFIRTVQFHPGDCPWILSASDDQTIRIWNWQSRSCLAVLTGHNHYVMCAHFHPRDDLIVSASLDQSVRVWDISGLRKKGQSAPPKMPSGVGLGGGGGMGGGVYGSDSGGRDPASQLQSDLFGNTDVVVKFIMEAHERGVNWAAFHPTQSYLVTAADDRLVKLWRINDSKVWEVDSFKGHYHNVSCALFHPRYDVVVSDSEDKTIRAWDLQKRTGLQTFRRENDRFWILAAHPSQNLLAAGHDSGLVLFKLVSERVSVALAGASQYLYVSNNTVRAYDLSSNRDMPVCSLRPKSSASTGNPLAPPPCQISFSAVDRALVLVYKTEGGQFELCQLPSDSNRGGEAGDIRRGPCQGAAFVGRKRFAVLDRKTISIRDLSNTEVKSVMPPAQADWLFPGPVVGTVLLRMDDRVAVFDLQQRRVLAEVPVSGVRHVIWSHTSPPRAALLSKDTVTVVTPQLEILGTAHEAMRVKSAAWDDASGILIYSTSSHLKYLLPQCGDHGIIRSLESPLYLATIRGNKVYCVDREGTARVIAVNPTEYIFKLALAQRRHHDVLRMVRDANLVGTALVAYLRKKGIPELALHFVHDHRLRFDLALECGNIDVALEAARAVNEPRLWRRLAQAALAQGNHQIVEMAYQKDTDFARLSFLYTATGNVEKLRKMLKIAQSRGDIESIFHNTLYLGDVEERAKALATAGLTQLAYLVSASHGLLEQADVYAKQTLEATPGGELPAVNPASLLLQPPIPIVRAGDGNWPLLNVSRGWADSLSAPDSVPDDHDEKIAQIVEAEGDGWNSAEGDLIGGPTAAETEATSKPNAVAAAIATDADGSEWVQGENQEAFAELDKAVASQKASGKQKEGGYYVPPTAGTSTQDAWCNNSNLAVDHAAAGDVAGAIQLLRQQVGVTNAAPLKDLFLEAFIGAHAFCPGLASTPAIRVPLHRNEATLSPVPSGRLGGLPSVACPSVAELTQRLFESYNMFTRAQVAEASVSFRAILHSALCSIATSRQEADELRELRGICREYLVALLLEQSRRALASSKTEPARQLELAAYLTHCNLQVPHQTLLVRAAMTSCFGNKNYGSAANFARRLLEFNPKPDVVARAQQICQYADTDRSDAHKLRYDERNPFSVCAVSLLPIYRGAPQILCPYCNAVAMPEHQGKECPVCLLTRLGQGEGLSGFQCLRPTK